MEYIYDAKEFYWNKEQNTFYADAWDLNALLPDNTYHPEAFPNLKEKFTIKNYETDGFRVFKFLKEEKNSFKQELAEGEFVDINSTDWVFESEDGIKASICVELN